MPPLRITALILIAIGVAILAFTFFRTPEDAMQRAWTEEAAHEKSQAGMALHHIAHMLEHPPNPARQKELMEELEAAQAKYDQIEDRFAALQARLERNHTILRWTGLALILLGGILYWQQREE